MRLLRRRPDPRELAAVLRRLERLRPSVPEPSVSGWLPRRPDAADDDPPGDVEPAPTHPQPSLGARLSGVRLHAFDPGRRGVAVLAVVAALGAAGGGWYFVHAAPRGAGAQASGSDPPRAAASSLPLQSAPAAWPTVAATGSGPPSTSAASTVVVDVVGKVAHAGVFTLPAGARVVDAIAAAGGALPNTDLTALDLAGRVLDGAEIFVGIAPPSGAAAQAAGGVIGGSAAGPDVGASGATTSAIVNLNTATAAELETLPGVGAVTAERILAWRTQHQRLTSVVQLQQVSGIGPAKYAALVGHVTT